MRPLNLTLMSAASLIDKPCGTIIDRSSSSILNPCIAWVLVGALQRAFSSDQQLGVFQISNIGRTCVRVHDCTSNVDRRSCVSRRWLCSARWRRATCRTRSSAACCVATWRSRRSSCSSSPGWSRARSTRTPSAASTRRAACARAGSPAAARTSRTRRSSSSCSRVRSKASWCRCAYWLCLQVGTLPNTLWDALSGLCSKGDAGVAGVVVVRCVQQLVDDLHDGRVDAHPQELLRDWDNAREQVCCALCFTAHMHWLSNSRMSILGVCVCLAVAECSCSEWWAWASRGSRSCRRCPSSSTTYSRSPRSSRRPSAPSSCSASFGSAPTSRAPSGRSSLVCYVSANRKCLRLQRLEFSNLHVWHRWRQNNLSFRNA